MFKIKNKLLASSYSIGQSFIELHTVDSTNNYATALVREGMAQPGTVVFAHRQTAGKGQRNKAWVTGEEENIAMSVVVAPRLPLPHMFLLSMATALAVHQFYSSYAGEEVKIKWPNDLYWRDRKAGGILIENILSGTEWKYAIVGIGININQTTFRELEQKAVSLKQITGRNEDVIALAKDLCSHLENAYTQLYNNETALKEKYHKNLYKLNEAVRLKKGSRVFDTTVKGVTANGQLITQHAVEELFDVGEVEWVF